MLIFTFQNNLDSFGIDMDKISAYLDVLGVFCQQFGFWFWWYWNFNGFSGLMVKILVMMILVILVILIVVETLKLQ